MQSQPIRPAWRWPALLATGLVSLGLCGTASATGLSGLSVTLVSFAPKASASPSTLYVDEGSIGGRCSDQRLPAQVRPSTPWCSLARAFAAAPAGSTVYVRAGTYPAMTIPAFAPTSTVTFAAYPGETPVIQGMSIGSSGSTSRNLTVTGMKITGAGVDLTNITGMQITGNEIALTPRPPGRCGASSCVTNTPDGMVVTPPASDLNFNDNYVHDGSVGVSLRLGHPPLAPGRPAADTFQHIAIHGNTFSRMGDVVLSLQNFEDITVSNNTFANDYVRGDVDPKCHCDAVHAIGGGDGLTLNGNLVYGGRGFLLQPGYSNGTNCASTCLTMTGAVVENNVFVGRDFGVKVLGSPGIRVVNNTIEGPAGSGLGLTFSGAPPATTGAVVANNLISYFEAASGVKFATADFNDVSKRGTGTGLKTPRGAHDIAGTPKFVDPQAPAYNFALVSGSPGSQSGSPNYAPAVDVPGWLPRRPPNMGADGGEMPRSGSRQVTAVGAANAGPPPGHPNPDSHSSVSRLGRVSVRRSAGMIVVDTGLEVSCALGRSCPLEITVTVLRPRGRRGSAHRRGAGRPLVARTRRSVAGGSAALVQLRLAVAGLARLAGVDRFVTLSVRAVLRLVPGVAQSSERVLRVGVSRRRQRARSWRA